MPTYDYRCKKCGHVFEVFHGMMDDTPRKCPKCKSRAEKMPGTGAGLLFKGSGFYTTDYRSSAYQDKAKQDRSSGAAAPAESSPAPAAATPAAGSASTPAATPSPAPAKSGRSRGKAARSKPTKR